MKKLFLFFFLLSLVFLCLGKDKEKRIAFYELDNERIYKIPVYLNKGVTTVMFPAEIEAIHSASVALNTVPDNSNPAFLMAYTPGKYYFSIRALRLKAQGLLNIVYQGKTYIIEISENEENALSSVTFNGGGGGGYLNRRGNGYAVSPYLLKSLMDKAKAWDVLIKKYPNMSVDVTISTERRVSDYEHIQCSIQKVWRFNRYDALVVYIELKNKTDKILYYNPREIALAVGDQKCFVSLVDASGEMPPDSTTFLFCVITQSSMGVRQLSPENYWRVLLFAQEQKRNREP